MLGQARKQPPLTKGGYHSLLSEGDPIKAPPALTSRPSYTSLRSVKGPSDSNCPIKMAFDILFSLMILHKHNNSVIFVSWIKGINYEKIGELMLFLYSLKYCTKFKWS